MAELIWSDVAIADLENIYDYIARDSRQDARHQIETIYQSVERLRHSPESGRHIPEFSHLPHREIIVDSYRVIYRYAADRGILMITMRVHGRHLLMEPLITK